MGRRKKRPMSSRRAMKTTMMMITVVVCILFIALWIGGHQLNKKIDAAIAYEDELKEEIANEEERKVEISELEEYMKTDEYVREVARDKLGLVDEGDIIFRKAD